jgi:hypothetical protein
VPASGADWRPAVTPGVKDEAASPIAIGPDDALVDVFDRIRAAGQTPVELRIPNDSSLFLTASEFRTLRDVTDHGRHAVTIRTPDPFRLQLAKLFGLDVALAAKPVPRPVATAVHVEQLPAAATNPEDVSAPGDAPAAAEAEPPKGQPASPADEAPDESVSSISESDAAARWPEMVAPKPVPAAPRRLLDRVSAAIATTRPPWGLAPEPETDASEASAGEASAVADVGAPDAPTEADTESHEREPATIHWVGDRRRPSPLVLAGAALLLALALIVAVTFLLPSARVRLVLAPVPINSALLFDVTVSGEPLDDQSAFALPGEPAEVTVVYEAAIPTTGVQTIADGTAAGTVRLANPSSTPITVEAGTILTTEAGAEFAITDAVEVPAADPATAAPGEADAAVQAVAPGADGNVGTGEIGGRLPNGVYYSNRQGATAGGTEREVAVVAQADLDALLAMADEALLGLVEQELALGEERAAVPPSLTVLDRTDSFDQTAGAEAEEVGLKTEQTVSLLTYDQAAASERLATALGDQLQAKVPAGFELGPVAIGADDVSAVEGSREGGRFRVDAEASAALALTAESEAALASQLAGKSPAEVEQILAGWPEVTSYEIEPGFRLFGSNLPAISGRIEIDDGS